MLYKNKLIFLSLWFVALNWYNILLSRMWILDKARFIFLSWLLIALNWYNIFHTSMWILDKTRLIFKLLLIIHWIDTITCSAVCEYCIKPGSFSYLFYSLHLTCSFFFYKTIKIRWTRHAGHCWRSRDKLISDVLLWTPSHGWAKAEQPARTFIQQFCANMGCSSEDLPEAMDDRGGERRSGIFVLMVW